MKSPIAIFSLLAIATSSSSADTILTSDGDGADTYVQQGPATSNFGAATNIVIKGGNGTTTRKGYLRFDTSSITRTVTAASIALTVSTNNSGGAAPVNGQTFNIDIFGLTNEALDNWVEGDNGTDNLPENEITYNNAPANINPGNELNQEEVILLGTLNVPGTLAGETVTFSDPNLTNFINNDTNGLVTIVMRRQSGGSNNIAFWSKEGTNTPSLDFSVGLPSPFVITEIVHDPEADAVTLTWPKSGAASYVARYSFDLTNWEGDLDDGLTANDDERPDDPDNITMTFGLSGLGADGKIFFRIEEEG